MNVEKFTFNGGFQVVKHCERDRGPGSKYGNISIDPNRSYLNENIGGIIASNGEKVPLLSYAETVRLLKAKTEKETGRAMQEKANTLVSIVVTLPKAYQAPKETPFKEWYTPQQRKKENEFWHAVFLFFKEKFALTFKREDGTLFSNVVYASTHRDETAPHIHFGFVPVVKETKISRKRYTAADGTIKEREICTRAGTICADAVINRDVLRKLHKELDSHLREKVSYYKGGILLSEEEKLRAGQNMAIKDLKALPEDFRQARNLANRLDALVQAVGDLRNSKKALEDCRQELKACMDPENFPPTMRLVRQLVKDGKLSSKDFVQNKVYKEAVENYKAYMETLRQVKKKLDTLSRGARDDR